MHQVATRIDMLNTDEMEIKPLARKVPSNGNKIKSSVCFGGNC